MIDKGVPKREDWPAGLLDELRKWEQGDVVLRPPVFYFADPAKPIWTATQSYTDTSTGPELRAARKKYIERQIKADRKAAIHD